MCNDWEWQEGDNISIFPVFLHKFKHTHFNFDFRILLEWHVGQDRRGDSFNLDPVIILPKDYKHLICLKLLLGFIMQDLSSKQ